MKAYGDVVTGESVVTDMVLSSKGLDEAQVSGFPKVHALSGPPRFTFCRGFSEAHSPAMLFTFFLFSRGLSRPFCFPERQAVFWLIHALVLVKDKRDPGGVIPAGIL